MIGNLLKLGDFISSSLKWLLVFADNKNRGDCIFLGSFDILIFVSLILWSAMMKVALFTAFEARVFSKNLLQLSPANSYNS